MTEPDDLTEDLRRLAARLDASSRVAAPETVMQRSFPARSPRHRALVPGLAVARTLIPYLYCTVGERPLATGHGAP